MTVKEDKDAKQKPFAEGLFYQPTSSSEKPHLIGSKCSVCGYVSFPKTTICPICIKEGTMNEVALGTKGKINSFTIARVAPQGFEAPYIAASVDLPEGPRVFAMITGCEPLEEALEIGTEAELVIEKLREDEEGNEIIGYKFRPV